jgi:hypothetical protein
MIISNPAISTTPCSVRGWCDKAGALWCAFVYVRLEKMGRLEEAIVEYDKCAEGEEDVVKAAEARKNARVGDHWLRPLSVVKSTPDQPTPLVSNPPSPAPTLTSARCVISLPGR